MGQDYLDIQINTLDSYFFLINAFLIILNGQFIFQCRPCGPYGQFCTACLISIDPLYIYSDLLQKLGQDFFDIQKEVSPKIIQ